MEPPGSGARGDVNTIEFNLSNAGHGSVQWELSSVNWMKLNADVGGCKNCSREFFFFFFSYDVDVAEAKVLRFGLWFAREVSLSPVTVESDSLIVVFLVLDFAYF